MRATKRYLTSLVALLALILTQFVPASPAYAANGPSISNNQNARINYATATPLGANGEPRVWGNSASTLQLSRGTWTTDNGTPTYEYAWYRCASSVDAVGYVLPANCDPISGATSTSYLVTEDDVAAYVLASVTATDTQGDTTQYTASTPQVSGAPVADAAPAITANGELVVGNSVYSSSVSWSRAVSADISYKWYLCNDRVSSPAATLAAGCTVIAGASDLGLTLVNTYKSKYLMVGSFAKNSATGTSTVASYSASTATRVVPAPAIKATVNGTGSTLKFTTAKSAKLNSKLTVDLTGWVTATAYAYKWFRCDQAQLAGESAPTGCAEIVGATSASYVVTAADVDKYVTGFVSAKNGTTQVAAARIAAATVTMQAPVNTVAPSVFGTPVAIGRSISAINGTWSASPAPEFSYQWYSCSVAVAAAKVKNAKCVALAGATSQSYEIASNQLNKFLVVEVRATNSTNTDKPVSFFSASSAKVMAGPVNTAAPEVTAASTTNSGQPIVGTQVNVTPGTWTGTPTPTKTYQWYLCDDQVNTPGDSVAAGCSELSAGTSVTTTLNMQGKFLLVAETAENAVSSVTKFSASTAAVQTKPIFDTDPSISGTARSGEILSVTSGASNVGGTPNGTYAWAKCSSAQVAGNAFGNGCQIIAGETGSSITLDSDQEGSYVVARVTLSNSAGTTVRTSAGSAQVTGGLINVSLPAPRSSNGLVQLGTAVSAQNGTWTGFPAPTFQYQWYRCNDANTAKTDSAVTGCSPISQATSSTYTPILADSGKYLEVKVTANQSNDSVSIWSPTSNQVLETPSFTGNPSTGSQHVLGGPRLTVILDGIRGVSDPTLTYAWYRCTSEVSQSTASLPAACKEIKGFTESSYLFVSEDVGKYVLALVTLTNELGTAKRFTSSSDLVNSAPANTVALAPTPATSPAQTGVVLTARSGTWVGNPTPEYHYQWYRCDTKQTQSSIEAPAGCVAINDQVGDTYTPTSDDSGKFVIVRVQGYNLYGNSIIFTPSTSDIYEVPSFIRGPSQNNKRVRDETVSLTGTATKGWPTPIENFQWYRCTSQIDTAPASVPAGCTKIAGATNSSYLIVQADVRNYLLLEEKIWNAVGSVTKYTTSTRQIQQKPEIAPTSAVDGYQWVGEQLTAVGVSVTGFPEPTTTIQWQRCISSFFCQDISLPATPQDSSQPLATGNLYNLIVADRSSSIRVKITANNGVGSAVVSYSTPTAAIGMLPALAMTNSAPITELNPPRVTDNDPDGEVRAATTVSASPGTWDATPAVDEGTGFSYKWYVCLTKHTTIAPVPWPDCTAVSAATDGKSTYQALGKDAGKYIGFLVTANNGLKKAKVLQTTSRFSITTDRIYIPPKYTTKTAKPVFAAGQAASDGSPRVGYQVDAGIGSWQGFPVPTYTYQWYRCDNQVKLESKVLPDGCFEIFDATSSVFNVTSAQIGKYLGVQITGTYKSVYSDFIFTPTTDKPVVSPPVNVTPPRITSVFNYVKATVKMNEGTWEATPKPTQAQVWWICDQVVPSATTTQPAGCTSLDVKTPTYTVLPSQEGKYLTVQISSTNTAGTSKMWTASTDQLVTGAVNLIPPKVSVVGATYASTISDLQISEAAAGDWVGTPDPVFDQYNWYRCPTKTTAATDLIDPSCVLIADNAYERNYRPVAADVGKYLVGAVRYSNSVGASVVYTASSDVINQPPNNLTPPFIVGAAFVGRELTADLGTWEAFPYPTNEADIFARQWLACDSQQLISSRVEPAGCTPISKATKATFTPTDDLLGKFLVQRVVATNIVGTQTVWSASTSEVVSGPVLKTAPTFTYPATRLNPIVGQNLSTDGGIWKGVPTPDKSYEWFVCDVAFVGKATAPVEADKCARLEGETSSTIVPNEDTRGKFLVAHIHARNIHGEDDFYSSSTTVVWMAPVAVTPVVPWGTPFNKLFLKAKQDTWKAFPELVATDKTYQWYQCSDASASIETTLPAGCTPVAGATASKWKIPVETPTGTFIRVKIKATNKAGTYEYFSATSGAVKPGPVNEKPPVLSGSKKFNINAESKVSGTDGTWSPASVTLTYQWYRCNVTSMADDELDPSCIALAGENTPNHTLGEFDSGKALVLGVTGTNTVNGEQLSSTYFSASTALILEEVRNVVVPSIAGIPRVETNLTGSIGEWRGWDGKKPYTAVSFWYACDKPIADAVVKIPTGTKCTKIGVPQDEKTYPIAERYIGKYITFMVSVSNSLVKKPVVYYAKSTEAIAQSPTFGSKPELVGPRDWVTGEAPSVGTDWTVDVEWTNVQKPDESFKWYRCDSMVDTANQAIIDIPEGCAEIGDAISKTYKVRVEDQDKFFLVAVTGTNAAGVTTQYTNTTEQPVGTTPLADPVPSVTGSYIVGSVLTADPGTWNKPSNLITISYSWIACDAPILVTTTNVPNCVERGTESTYKIAPQDANPRDSKGKLLPSKYITVVVSGRVNKATTSYAVAVTEAVSQAPVNTNPPEISADSYLVGKTLSATDDTWTGSPIPLKSYKWYSCTQQVAEPDSILDQSCTLIPNENSSTYVVQEQYLSKYILVSVTGTNAAGSQTVFSRSLDIPIAAPYVEGTTKVSLAYGSTAVSPSNPVTITATPGTWTLGGSPANNVVLLHRWYRCTSPVETDQSSIPAGCSGIFPIPKTGTINAQDQSLTLTLDMATQVAGFYIASVEFLYPMPWNANTYDGQKVRGLHISASTTKIQIAPTLWTDHLNALEVSDYKEPSVTTASLVGAAMSVSHVQTWQGDTSDTSRNVVSPITWRGVGTSPGTFSYRWFSCTSKVAALSLSLPSGCDYVAGATSESFTPTANEIRKFIGVAILATNSAGSYEIWTKTSEKTNMVPTLVSGQGPALNQVAYTQETASVSTGSWLAEPSATFSYRWFLCDTTQSGAEQYRGTTEPSGCTKIANATSASVTIPTLNGRNLHKVLVAQVVATNKPYLSTPTVNASTYEGTRSVELQELPYFGSINPVDYTTDTTPDLKTNVGETMRIINGQDKWFGSPIGVSGLTFDYSWYTCQLPISGQLRTSQFLNDYSCAVIDGQITDRYTLTKNDVGKRVVGLVKATSGIGVGYANTKTSDPVGEKAYVTGEASVTTNSVPMVGDRITGNPGTFDGFKKPILDTSLYTWYVCNNPVASASLTVDSSCSVLLQNAPATYTIMESVRGKYLLFSSSAHNDINPVGSPSVTVRQYSATTAQIMMAPKFASEITISGDRHVGQILTVTMPSVTAYPAQVTTDFEWYSCDKSYSDPALPIVQAGCNKVGNTNDPSIRLTADLAGTYIYVFATSSNVINGNTVTTRANSITKVLTGQSVAYVTNTPTIVSAPVANGSTPVLVAGGSVSAVIGTWKSFPATSSKTYAWYLCSGVSDASATKPVGCAASPISAATSSPVALSLLRAYAGSTIVLQESVTQPSNNFPSTPSSKTATYFSASTSVINAVPLFDTEPSITGTRHVGETLTADTGNVSGYPTPSTSIQWMQCTSAVSAATSSAPASCTDISGATGNTFVLGALQADKYITVKVIASNTIGGTSNQVTRYAVTGNLKVTQTPSLVSSVTIAGATEVSGTNAIIATAGSWTGAPAPTLSYQWYLCDTEKVAASATVGSDCLVVTGSNGAALSGKTLTLKAEYRGKYVVAQETATSSPVNKAGAGTNKRLSTSLGPINMAPTFNANPSFDGVVHVGQTLTANVPSVTAYPENASTYEWMSCSSAVPNPASALPANCVLIPNAGNDDLVISEDLAGRFIGLVVTNSNSFGGNTNTAVKTSSASIDVTQSLSNLTGATLSGEPTVGSLSPLLVSPGTWSSAPATSAGSFSYAWYQCSNEITSVPNSLPNGCTLIAGATSQSYFPVDGNAGKFILAKVTASVRSNLSTDAPIVIYTRSSAAVQNRPQITLSPSISGTAHLGSSLQYSAGTATGFEAPTNTYQWWNCSAAVSAGTTDVSGSCVAIDGATSSSYTITSGDIGDRIVVVMTSSNNQGSVSKSSASTAVVTSSPVLVTAPTISGSTTYVAGGTVSVSKGTWSGNPAPTNGTFSYTWYKCSDVKSASSSAPTGCTIVQAAGTSSSFALSSAVFGSYLVAKVTVVTTTNLSATDTASTYTDSIGPINSAPINTAAPTFIGTLRVGQTITAGMGAWSGFPTNYSYAYRWYICAATATNATLPSECTPISMYDSVALVVPANALNKKLMLAVTATNDFGSATKTAITSVNVAAAASINPLFLRAIL